MKENQLINPDCDKNLTQAECALKCTDCGTDQTCLDYCETVICQYYCIDHSKSIMCWELGCDGCSNNLPTFDHDEIPFVGYHYSLMNRDTCDNGSKDNYEECDDGNHLDGDGCSRFCLVEHGYKCPEVSGPCRCFKIDCGNGKIDRGEQCDDGNDVDDDYCNNKCMINTLSQTFMFSKLNKGQ